MISSFDGKWSFKKKFESLLKEIQKQAEIDSKHFVIFIDEIPPEFFESCSEYDSTLNQLHDECSLIHVFMAISPIGRHLTMPLQLNFSDGNKVFVQQLQTRHRNSFPLSAFLIHMTYKYNDFKVKRSIVRAIFQQKSTSKYQCLSPSDDTPLDSSNLPDGDVTLWYHRSNDVTEIEALKFFKETYLPTNGEVLVSPSGKNLPTHIYRWCSQNDWDVVSHTNVTGTERDLVIAFVDGTFGNLEVMSRARKRLIIVTR